MYPTDKELAEFCAWMKRTIVWLKNNNIHYHTLDVSRRFVLIDTLQRRAQITSIGVQGELFK